MKIALIRHGHTIGNMYGAYIGKQSDPPLCSEGRETVEKNRRAAAYPSAEIVFSSPMQRCLQTVELIYPREPVNLIEELKERDFGLFEGMNYQEIIKIPTFENWGQTPEDMIFPKGEDWKTFSRRSCEGFMQALKKIAAMEVKAASVICHGGTIMAIMEQFVYPDSSRYQWQVKPGSGYILNLDTGTGSMVLYRRICP